MNWTLKDIEDKVKMRKIKGFFIVGPKQEQSKKSKYGNEKTEVEGIVFQSRKEANYYKLLLIQLKAGWIGFIERQVPFELNEGGTYSLKYFADFVYVDMVTGEKKVIDVKGFRTREYKKKKRLMKKIYNISIIEI